MQHYSLEDWADFARDVVAKGKKAAMQSHLETGCKPCTKVHSLWQRLNETARRESAYRPPDQAVKTVKGLGAIHGISKPRKATTRLADLLFDSFRNPMQAGVRSTATTARQLLYGAGNYRIDVRIEPLDDSEKLALVGQVLNASDPAKTMPSLPVVLYKGGKILSVSKTNSFGEFHLECNLQHDLKLHFKIPGEKEVWIPLVSPASEAHLDSPDSVGVNKLMNKVRKSTRKKV